MVDGVFVGETPKTFKVGVCARRVEVSDSRYTEQWGADLELQERKTLKVVADLGRDKDDYEAMQAELEAQAQRDQADLERRKAEARQARLAEIRARQQEAEEEEEEQEEYYDDEGSSYEGMEQLRLDLVVGLNRCFQVDSNECSEDEMGIAFEGGLYYYMNPFFGVGIAAAVARWDGFAELLHTRVNAMAVVNLPLGGFEMSAAAGIGLARLGSELSGSESLGASVPVSARMGYFAYEGILIGFDATANIDLFDSGQLLISGQFGPFLEFVFN